MAQDSARQAINLRALQRSDPTIRTICDSSGYVVVYRFAGGKWAKEGIEGSLFIYQRTAQPQNGILVLNRNGINNLVRHIRPGTALDAQGQMLHVGGDEADGDGSDTLGFWFASGEAEAARLLKTVESLQAARSSPAASAQPTSPTPHPAPSTNGAMPVSQSQPTMMDLLSRLSTTPSTPPPKLKSPNIFNPSPLPQHSTPQPQASTSASMSMSNLNPSIDPSTSLKQLLGLASRTTGEGSSSPTPGPATPVRTKSKQTECQGDSGYIPSPQRNDIPNETAFDKDAAKKAVLSSIKRSGDVEGYGSGEESVEGQREFVRQLLNSIHTDKEFTKDLYQEYCRRQQRKAK